MRSEAELREALEVHGPHVYRFLRARGLSEQTAQDVYQDVFEIFLTSNQRFENAEHKRRWLIRVASNRCKQYYRKASTQRETPVSNESFYDAFALWREILASRGVLRQKPRDLGICGRSLTGAAGMHLPFLCGGILNGGNCRNGAIEPVDGARAPEKSSPCSGKTLSKGAL